MQTAAEIEAAIAKLPARPEWEIAKWLEESLLSEETPAMLAALDEGIRSLETEPLVPLEEVPRRIKKCSTTNIS